MSSTYQMNLVRDKLIWSQEIWNRIDQAVHDEAQRTKIAEKFLPLYPVPPETTTVPSDAVESLTSPLLSVNEAAVTPLLEIWVDFSLTKQQYEDEERLRTAVTLAVNAANKIARAEDLLIFQGSKGFEDDLFQQKIVNLRGSRRLPAGAGTRVSPPFDIVGLLPVDPDQIISVNPTCTPDPANPAQNRYGENIFEAVARAYSVLQKTHYGRQALVLPTGVYADTYAPLSTTLIMPADRIKGLVENRFYGTSSLPDQFVEQTRFPEGVQVALDGNTMDLVVGLATTTAFIQVDGDGLYRFRVFERFTLRLKDRKAVVELDFQGNHPQPSG